MTISTENFPWNQGNYIILLPNGRKKYKFYRAHLKQPEYFFRWTFLNVRKIGNTRFTRAYFCFKHSMYFKGAFCRIFSIRSHLKYNPHIKVEMIVSLTPKNQCACAATEIQLQTYFWFIVDVYAIIRLKKMKKRHNSLFLGWISFLLNKNLYENN